MRRVRLVPLVVLGLMIGACTIPLLKGARHGFHRHEEPVPVFVDPSPLPETGTGSVAIGSVAIGRSAVGWAIAAPSTCSRCGHSLGAWQGETVIGDGGRSGDYVEKFRGCIYCLVDLLDDYARLTSGTVAVVGSSSR